MIAPFARTMVVRGYEVDDTRTTPLPVVLSYLEQLRWEWIAAPEWGLAEGVHTGHFFVVRHQVLELVDRPRFGEALTITGEIEKVGRSLVQVRHVLTVGDRRAGHARVSGVWLGPDRRLAKLPDAARAIGREQSAALGELALMGADADAVLPGDEALSFIDAPRRVYRARGLDLAAEAALEAPVVAEVTVRPSDCDVFAHVNASQYLRYFDDARLALGHPGLLQRVALDYRNEALAGDRLSIRARRRSETLLDMTLERGDEVLCAAVLGVIG
ncbi:MAG: hypothetical protein H6737_31325 [Alphaproteobacteria bacterium]|nr:hypothetical protein [Alphaproteobacteria bacterium]